MADSRRRDSGFDRKVDRRRFLSISGVSLGFAALYRYAPGLGLEGGTEAARELARANGEAPRPFTFVQLSDTHVGSTGPANPNGTHAFERAVETINALSDPPELVLFTGDLTHDSEKPGEPAERMAQFRKIAAGLKAPAVRYVPGEHDAGLDGGDLFRENLGPTYYSFDHRGVHFVALDNVSRGKPVVGAEQLAWLAKDLARFPKTAPLVVFTHRPLFDLRPDWEWFTNDGGEVMKLLAPYRNVTILYGHIHREHVFQADRGGPTHYAAKSLAWAFPDPTAGVPKKPIAFDPAKPFANLGARTLREKAGEAPKVSDVELTVREFSGTNGIQQLFRSEVTA
jgi:hypothetical protein